MSRPFDRVANAGFFDGIAARYDAHRPTYPDGLLDRGCAIAGLRPGDPVLEIGPGTGHLTVGLYARGLDITAVEPGANLIEIARTKTPRVSFLHTSLEQAELPAAHFRAVFAASSIHWPDPDVSWSVIHRALAPGGTLELISFFGLATPASDQEAQLDILTDVAPEMYATFPRSPTRQEVTANFERDRANVSTAWQPYTLNDISREYAADLFDDVALDVVEEELHQTAAQTIDVLSTIPPTSLSHRTVDNRRRRRRRDRPQRTRIRVITGRGSEPVKAGRPRAGARRSSGCSAWDPASPGLGGPARHGRR